MADWKKVFGEKLKSKDGSVDTASACDNKVVALYFSAHWCPPCRAFTPVLAKAYEDALKAGAKFELVFVSSDQDEEGFEEYFGTHPWKAVAFEDEETREALGKTHSIRGIPALVVLNSKGEVITKEGRAAVQKDKENAIIEWAKSA